MCFESLSISLPRPARYRTRFSPSPRISDRHIISHVPALSFRFWLPPRLHQHVSPSGLSGIIGKPTSASHSRRGALDEPPCCLHGTQTGSVTPCLGRRGARLHWTTIIRPSSIYRDYTPSPGGSLSRRSSLDLAFITSPRNDTFLARACLVVDDRDWTSTSFYPTPPRSFFPFSSSAPTLKGWSRSNTQKPLDGFFSLSFYLPNLPCRP